MSFLSYAAGCIICSRLQVYNLGECSMMTTIFVVYIITVLCLMFYGFHSYYLIILFYRKQKKVRRNIVETVRKFYESTQEKDLPRITIQLPVYNEGDIVKRLMLSATQVDYPQDKLEIQVVDDSSDETIQIVDNYAKELQKSTGVDIYVVRREGREQFKAGALANGLKTSKGEYVAIFDSDFIIPKDFLKRSIAQIHNRPGIACVQSRWGHINRFENWLTKGQSIALDAHFAASQGARSYNGLCMNFNGTAGIWRVSAIEAVGGWSGDTLTEDMDLSYRVQLHGYKMVFDFDLVCPAELPNGMMAFKSQQKRWAKGAVETGIKLLPSIFKSKNLSFAQKFEAFMHLTNNFVAVLMIVLTILTLPVLIAAPRVNYGSYLPLMLVIVVLASISPCVLYVGSGAAQKKGFFSFRNFPVMLALGTGLCVNNALAVFEAVIGKKSPFIRTPKSGSSDTLSKRSKYKVSNHILPGLFEFLLGIYCLITFVVYIITCQYFFGFFIGAYGIGLTLFGFKTLKDAWSKNSSLEEATVPVSIS